MKRHHLTCLFTVCFETRIRYFIKYLLLKHRNRQSHMPDDAFTKFNEKCAIILYGLYLDKDMISLPCNIPYSRINTERAVLQRWNHSVFTTFCNPPFIWFLCPLSGPVYFLCRTLISWYWLYADKMLKRYKAVQGKRFPIVPDNKTAPELAGKLPDRGKQGIHNGSGHRRE